jgi:hypothetical protein
MRRQDDVLTPYFLLVLVTNKKFQDHGHMTLGDYYSTYDRHLAGSPRCHVHGICDRSPVLCACVKISPVLGLMIRWEMRLKWRERVRMRGLRSGSYELEYEHY